MDNSDFTINKVRENILEAYTGNSRIVNIPYGITSIGKRAFSGNENMFKVTIPDTVKEIGEDAFYYCRKLKYINIPESVKRICDAAFTGCGFTEITIPKSVNEVGYNAFGDCVNLQSVLVKEGVKKIGGLCFLHCPKLKKVILPKSIEKIEPGTFGECHDLTLYVHEGSIMEAYASQNMIPYRFISELGKLETGTWEQASDGDGVVCSVCGKDFCTITNDTDNFHYCPNCGSKMDKGEY